MMETVQAQVGFINKLFEMFGQYGLVGLMICFILCILVFSLYWSGKRTDMQIRAQNEQITGFSTSIVNQGAQISAAVQSGLKDQATEFVAALNQIRQDHNTDRMLDRESRDKMLQTIERLATNPAVPTMAVAPMMPMPAYASAPATPLPPVTATVVPGPAPAQPVTEKPLAAAA